MPGRMEFEFRFRESNVPQPAKHGEETPFRILLLGDFGGTAPARDSNSSALRPIAVDLDNFEAILERLTPSFELPRETQDPPTVVTIRTLDDFHPDSLYQRLEVFGALRRTRDELRSPATFRLAAARLLGESAQAQTGPPQEPQDAAETAPVAESEDATLKRLLGRPPAEHRAGSTRGAPAIDITRFLREIVGPYIVPEKDPRADSLVRSVDEASEATMRAILRAPRYRCLEAAWRGLHNLVASEECGANVRIYALDAAPERLAADLFANSAELDRSVLYRNLVEAGGRAADGQSLSLLVGALSFGPDEPALRLLGALGAIARRVGAPFIAAATPALVGCSSWRESPYPADWRPLPADAEEAWSTLRRSPVAPWIGLAAPRVLMRLPYGKRTDPVECFEFEEMPEDPDHEALPWGHPVFVLARLLARSFAESGFAMEAGDHREFEDLPAHTYEKDGERHLTPCAEAFLTDAAVEALLGRGLMPVVSYRNRPAVLVPRFQSIADPAAPLAGPWR